MEHLQELFKDNKRVVVLPEPVKEWVDRGFLQGMYDGTIKRIPPCAALVVRIGLVVARGDRTVGRRLFLLRLGVVLVIVIAFCFCTWRIIISYGSEAGSTGQARLAEGVS